MGGVSGVECRLKALYILAQGFLTLGNGYTSPIMPCKGYI